MKLVGNGVEAAANPVEIRSRQFGGRRRNLDFLFGDNDFQSFLRVHDGPLPYVLRFGPAPRELGTGEL